MYDVAIIGAGIIGTFIARELSKYKLNIIIIEKNNDVANGTTKANSAIIHAGYDAKPNTMKAEFNVRGNTMFEQICRELDVPFKRIGSFVVAFSDVEMHILKEIYNRGIKNNVPQLRLIQKYELKGMEPNISEEAVGALYAPTAGIIGPWELAIALAENAVGNGVELLLNNEVLRIEKMEIGYRIFTNLKQIQSKYIINCAGVYADKIHNMVAKPSFVINPRKGQYYLLDKSTGNLLNKIIFQCPTEHSKGVVTLPTVHGNLLVGPDAEDIEDKEDTGTTDEGMKYVKEMAKKSCNHIPFSATITSFAGLRASSNTGDFIIKEVDGASGFIDVAGIESPGLSASPAITEYVVNLLRDIDGNFQPNDKFNPIRKKVICFMDLSLEEKQKLIKADKRYGRIICRCENITEGEIVDAIHRNVGGRTVDGLKRRVRPGSGRCQGGFCQPKIIDILARELELDITEILKDSLGSNVAISETKQKALGGDQVD